MTDIFKLKKLEGNKSFGKGIFINKLKVKSIENISGAKLAFADWTPDSAIEVTFETDVQFDKKLIIAGDFSRDKGGVPTGLGSAFKVLSFFQETLGLDEPTLTDTGDIPHDYMTSSIGKEVYVLDFVYGFNPTKEKPKYKSWDVVLAIDKDPAALGKRFLQQVEKGFIKKYAPDAIPDKGDKEESTFPSIPAISDDDDLPF